MIRAVRLVRIEAMSEHDKTGIMISLPLDVAERLRDLSARLCRFSGGLADLRDREAFDELHSRLESALEPRQDPLDDQRCIGSDGGLMDAMGGD